MEEYNEMLVTVRKWIEKAKVLVHGNIAWNSASQLQEQYILHQVNFREKNKVKSKNSQSDWVRPTDNFVKYQIGRMLGPHPGDSVGNHRQVWW